VGEVPVKTVGVVALALEHVTNNVKIVHGLSPC
jgi:hypothetical protein